MTQKTPPRNGGSIKISCRNLWKIYGADPAQFFKERDGAVDRAATIERALQLGHICAMSDVSFDVQLGEIFVIMGLSGSGKSTLLRCLSRLVEPSAGQIFLDDVDLLKVSARELIEVRRHRMGMVFQSFGLLPHQTVLENVAFPLKVQGITRPDRERRAVEMIELVGLAGRETAFPRELSGGQQQRVGIARSLAVDPAIWLLDEPFSALDPLIRRQLQDEFLRLQHSLRKTIIFVTHDFLEASRLADRIAIMKEGRIVQLGTPTELVLRPADEYVRKFTQDVSKAKVISAGDIVEAATGNLDIDKAVPVTTSLEDLMPKLVVHSDALPVTDGLGNVVGQVSLRGLVTALVAAERNLGEK